MFDPEDYWTRNVKDRNNDVEDENNQNFNNPTFVQLLLKKANKVKDVNRIDPIDFYDLYGKEAVDAELSWVAQQKAGQEKRNSSDENWHKDISQISETFFCKQFKISRWLGERVCVQRTSEYDDFMNGIDLIAEIRHPNQKSANYCGFALDITLAEDITTIARKIERIYQKIDDEKLPKIKYFKSDFLNIRGEKSNIPLFVIGCDLKHFEQLTKLWYNEKQDALSEHPEQIILLYQIIQQSQIFRDYARSKNKLEIADIYNQSLQEFMTIYQERREIIEKIKSNTNNKYFFANDIVSANIIRVLKDYVQPN